MPRHSHLSTLPRMFFGLGIAAVGVIFLLGNLDVIYAREYLRYWPAILIIVGLAYMLQPGTWGARVWGGLLAFAGAGLLLDRLGYIDFNVWHLWPIVIVFIGANLVYQSLRRRDSTVPVTGDDESVVNASAIMGGIRRTSTSPDFRGGDMTAIMGGMDVDLRNAKIVNEASIEIFAFWGGIELRVPEDWTVVVKVLPIMGGVDDKTTPPKGESKKRLILTGTAIMGGVEVKN